MKPVESVEFAALRRDMLEREAHFGQSGNREGGTAEIEPGMSAGDLEREARRDEAAAALRRLCQFCGEELPGSNPFGARISHGVCTPLCAEARAMGWES